MFGLKRKRKLELDEGELEALLFHYHKYGIPESQTAAKRLEKKLCDFLGEEPRLPVPGQVMQGIFPIRIDSKTVKVIEADDGVLKVQDQGGEYRYLEVGESLRFTFTATGLE